MMSRPPAAWALVLAGVLGCTREGWSYSNGSVASSCDTLLPGHHSFSPSNLTAPYNVTASATTYRPGERITGAERWPVGCFTNINTNLINTLHCSGQQNSSVSHSSASQKRVVQVTWEAPNNSNHGDVYFCATFVQTYSTFWVEVSSATLRPAGSAAAEASRPNLFILTGLALPWFSLST